MKPKPTLYSTRDYDLFEMGARNREINEKPLLLASMKEHGFMPSSAIHCVRTEAGKLRIVRGHHRFHYAKRLGLEVYYILDDSNTDIYALEGDSSSHWSLRDFIVSRARAGNEEYQAVLDFQEEHGLTLGMAITLMGGDSKKTGHRRVKDGSFEVSEDLRLARAVVDVTDHFKSCGVSFATQAAFVGAVQLALRVPECDPNILKRRASQWPAEVRAATSTDGYLKELDALYNRGAKAKNRLPLAFRAKEVARIRRQTFGRSDGPVPIAAGNGNGSRPIAVASMGIAAAILAAFEARGFSFQVDGATLVVTPVTPAVKVTHEDIETIRPLKADIITLLRRRGEEGSEVQ